jgi:enoyl-CoA hydratase/carnithine racemase
MPEPEVLLECRDGVARLTLNRPQARNALSKSVLDLLLGHLETIAGDTAVRVVVLAGNGPAFCAGHDLKEMRSQDFAAGYAERLFRTCADVMLAIRRLPQPVIARVHGIATAAGAQLVATADLALCADDARFATPGVNIGLFCSTPMVALSRNLGHKHALQMLLTGDLIDAATAVRFGLVNAMVPAVELDAAVDALAAKIAAKSRFTVGLGKARYYQQAELGEQDAYALAAAAMVCNLQAHDAREGISAFIDKRVPEWQDG